MVSIQVTVVGCTISSEREDLLQQLIGKVGKTNFKVSIPISLFMYCIVPITQKRVFENSCRDLLFFLFCFFRKAQNIKCNQAIKFIK